MGLDSRIIRSDLPAEYRRDFAADKIRRKATFKNADMKSIVKRILLAGCVLLMTIPATLYIIPFFLDVQKYKPRLEQQVMEAIGRPFEVDDQLRLSLFPRTRFWFSDLRLANPSGFTEKDFIKAKIIEVRFNLLSFFLSGLKNLQPVRVCMRVPQMVLVKRADGSTNWEGMDYPFNNILKKMNTSGKKFSKNTATDVSPQVALMINRISIRDGSVLWIDHHKKRRLSVSHLDMDLTHLHPDKPVRISLSAKWDGRPLALKGKIGPLRSVLEPGTIPVKLSISALKQLKLNVNGHLVQPLDKRGFNFFLKLSKFSIPKLAAAAGRPIPISLSDKTALNKVAFKGRVSGDYQRLDISEGILVIDDSKFNLSVKLPDYSRPEISFGCSMDQIDLNRYLLSGLFPKQGGLTESKGTPSFNRRVFPIKGRNNNPLRLIVMRGSLVADRIKVGNTVVKNFKATLAAKNGILHFAPVSSDLYGGKLAASGSINFRKKAPKSDLRLYTKNIQLRPLILDMWQTDFLAGTLNSKITLRMTGYNSVQIKKSLSGKGDIRIDKGEIIGIDLLAMVQNNADSFCISKFAGKKLKTVFSTLLIPFSINRGRVFSHKASLSSPSVRIAATGKTDMVEERLDIRLQPVSVGSGPEKNQSSDLLVPVHIFGSFSDPAFKPALNNATQNHQQ
jgi:uncharacterized protein involved in outer membrane biogenesis